MGELRLTSDAERDLTRIWEDIALDNVSAANRVISEIRKSMEMLAEMPEAAPERPGLSRKYPNLRAWPVPEYSNYLVFFLPEEGGILVIRVLHGRRKIEDILE